MAEISTPSMARAARACVSVMLPPPIRPMWKVMFRRESMIRRHEVFVGSFGGFGSGDRRRDQDAVAEGYAGIRGKREMQLFLTNAEDFLAERVGGKKAVAARVPIGGKAGIGGVIENGDGHRFVTDQTAEVAAASTSAPGGVAFFAFAGEVGAVDAGVVQFGDGRGAATRVSVDLGFVGGNLESADNAKAQDTVFLILEIDFFFESAEGGDAVHAAKAGPAAEDKVRVFPEQNFFVEGDPIGFDVELALLRTAFCGDDGMMDDGAHLGRVLGFDGVRIVPEIEAIDIFIVEPEARVMGMVNAFARALLKRIAASDDGSFGGSQWIENGFFEHGGPNVRGEGLAVDGDVDAAGLFVDGDGDAVGRMGAGGDERREKRGYRNEDDGCTGNENAHGYLWPPMMVKSLRTLCKVYGSCRA